MLKLIRTLVITGAAAVPLALVSISAQAGTATTTFAVTATVVAACNINSATSLAFGSYNPTSATAATGTSTISVTCTKNSPYVIALSFGVNGGNSSNRIMKDAGTDKLNYNLYTDSLFGTVWLDSGTCAGPSNYNTAGCMGSAAAAGTAESYTVHGQITALQNVPVGNYSDTITVNVNF